MLTVKRSFGTPGTDTDIGFTNPAYITFIFSADTVNAGLATTYSLS